MLAANGKGPAAEESFRLQPLVSSVPHWRHLSTADALELFVLLVGSFAGTRLRFEGASPCLAVPCLDDFDCTSLSTVSSSMIKLDCMGANHHI